MFYYQEEEEGERRAEGKLMEVSLLTEPVACSAVNYVDDHLPYTSTLVSVTTPYLTLFAALYTSNFYSL